MYDKLDQLAARHREVEQLISDPEVHKDPKRYKELMQEHSHLTEVVTEYNAHKNLKEQLEEANLTAAEVSA